MKYLVVLCDGMADTPSDYLNGKTPMELADKPTMDEMAKVSEVGLCRTVAKGLKPGSDVANLSVMGYDLPFAIQVAPHLRRQALVLTLRTPM